MQKKKHKNILSKNNLSNQFEFHFIEYLFIFCSCCLWNDFEYIYVHFRLVVCIYLFMAVFLWPTYHHHYWKLCSGFDFYSENANATSNCTKIFNNTQRRGTRTNSRRQSLGLAKLQGCQTHSTKPAKSAQQHQQQSQWQQLKNNVHESRNGRRSNGKSAVAHKLAFSVFVTKSNSYYFKNQNFMIKVCLYEFFFFHFC